SPRRAECTPLSRFLPDPPSSVWRKNVPVARYCAPGSVCRDPRDVGPDINNAAVHAQDQAAFTSCRKVGESIPPIYGRLGRGLVGLLLRRGTHTIGERKDTRRHGQWQLSIH